MSYKSILYSAARFIDECISSPIIVGFTKFMERKTNDESFKKVHMRYLVEKQDDKGCTLPMVFIK